MSLIKHISPYCTYFDFIKLEKLLLNYFTHKSAIYKWACTFYPNRCKKFRQYEYRQADIQLNILKSIPASLRSMKLDLELKSYLKLLESLIMNLPK